MLTDRLFIEDPHGLMLPDTPQTRLLVHAWAAMAEGWCSGGRRSPTGSAATRC